MAKAVIWGRVSTTEQEYKTQVEKLTQKAIEDGFSENELINIGEAGASAIKMNELYQQEVKKLLDTIDADPQVTTVYVWEVSRLARNELAFYKMKSKLLDNPDRRIQLICQVPSLKLLDDDGEVNTGAEITLNLLVTLAKQEMEIKSKRFKRGKEKLAKEGKYNGGAIPYGYRKDPERDNLIVEDEYEGGIVREIFDMYEHGYSQMRIAREMEARGERGRSARTTYRFTLSLVHQILTNELLTGKKHLNKGSSYERQYPPIITKDQFDRCREIAHENNRVLSKTKDVHYAIGLIRCTNCGRTFISSGYKGYYYCRDAYNGDKKYYGYIDTTQCTNRTCISYNVIDSLLWQLAQDYEASYIIDEASTKLLECKNEVAILEKKLANMPDMFAEIEKKKDLLLDALAEGMKKDRFRARKDALAREERDLNEKAAEYKSQIQHYKTFINELEKNLDSSYGATMEEYDKYVHGMLLVRAKVALIEDDEERSRIIHKHIKEVTVEPTRVMWKFGVAPEGKMTNAKKIIVDTYLWPEREFLYIPSAGKGKDIFEKRPGPRTPYNDALGQEVLPPVDSN